MGTPALLLASTGLSLLSSMSEQKAIEKQAQAEQTELVRQQNERDRIAAEEKADAVREADRRAAAAIVAMEARGGAGSQNEGRFAREIAGLKALDLSRLEGNRSADVASLQASIKASRNRAKSAISKSRASFLSDSLGNLGQYNEFKERQADRDEDVEDARKNEISYPQVSRI